MSGKDKFKKFVEEGKTFLTETADYIGSEAKTTLENLRRQYGKRANGFSWPQTYYDPNYNKINPNYKTIGLLPPTEIEPTLSNNEIRYGNYIYKDWRGYSIVENNINKKQLTPSNRFDKKNTLPSTESELDAIPYSTRDYYSIFNDSTTDYFRYGLQVVDNFSNILSKDSYIGTPFENNDPIIIGFDIIIDDLSSPLLNGSIDDFLLNYSNISEIAARNSVYNDFKKQFSKIFKTKSTLVIDESTTKISNMNRFSGDSTQRDSILNGSNKKAYLNYYLKKIGGIDKLIEQNTPTNKKYLADYNKDIISLSFSEDVSLSMGTLAHLYKLLYWSKPNGKGIIPENLLRFNCDIIVSEVRNFKRVIRVLDENSETEEKRLKIIKDNVSRYVYSLRECQFYFNTLPVTPDIDMGMDMKPFTEGGYSIQFDYKYSTVRLERFVPDQNGFGKYVGYNSGAIWRIGNTANRADRQAGRGKSIPSFYTEGENSLNQNGVTKPFILNNLSENIELTNERGDLISLLSETSTENAKKIQKELVETLVRSSKRELQTYINTRTAMLNKTLSKIYDSVGVNGIQPPTIGTKLNAPNRVFYDVRGQLLNFVGESISTRLSPR